MGKNYRDQSVAVHSVSKFRDRYVKVYNRAVEGHGAVGRVISNE